MVARLSARDYISLAAPLVLTPETQVWYNMATQPEDYQQDKRI